MLAGTATANAPFSIVAGGSYNLSAGQSQNVTVRFTPTSASNFASNVTFTGGGDTSLPVAVVGLPAATLSAAPSTIVQGGSATATWSGITAPTATKSISLHPTGASDHYTSRISWQYTTGTASGNVSFTIPATTAPGTYELRLFTKFTYTRIGKSNTFTVITPPQASLSVTPSSMVAGGSVTATWSGISAPTATDWIGLYPTGASDHYTSRISWQYTTGTASGNVSFTIPATVAPGLMSCGYSRTSRIPALEKVTRSLSPRPHRRV